jgi:Cu(I)/Ag(I) efflux system membrane fusion protein
MNTPLVLSRRQFLGSAMAAAGFLAALPSCRRVAAATAPDIAYYTCTMHPSVREAVPGNCPICGMQLVPVYRKGAAETAAPDAGADTFVVSPARQQMIGVTFATVRRSPLRKTVRATGTVASQLQRRWDCVSRVEGYVRNLAVSSEGDAVVVGQPLLTLYSPELLASERELVNALEARDDARGSGSAETAADAERLLAVSRRRLGLLGVDDREIAALERSREPSDTVTLFSPAAGVIESIPTQPGRRIAPGDRLVTLVDLSSVWVWAQFYQEELPLIRSGAPVSIGMPSQTGAVFDGRIGPTDPVLDDASRSVRVRIDVENPRLALRPGMYVDVELPIDGGSGLVVPLGAVLPTGQRNIVFVDKGGGSLEPRAIELGGKFGDDYAVLSGLREGERVVSSANFLIDAEAKVQGALKSW